MLVQLSCLNQDDKCGYKGCSRPGRPRPIRLIVSNPVSDRPT